MTRNPSPSIGVKYCGGCNPVYNRRAILDRLRHDYPEAVIRFVSEEPVPEAGIVDSSLGALPDDLAIVICGCRNECFDYSGYVGKHGQILIFSQEDYGRIEDFMTAWEHTVE